MTLNLNNQFNKAITPREVLDFHNKDDVDSGQLAHHHTLGKGPLQAAPGNHTHDPIIEEADLTSFFASPNGFVMAATAYKTISGQVTVIGVATAEVAHGGGTAISLIPAGFRPIPTIPTSMYFYGADAGTGAATLMFIDAGGGFYHTFARGAGTSTYFCISYPAGA